MSPSQAKYSVYLLNELRIYNMFLPSEKKKRKEIAYLLNEPRIYIISPTSVKKTSPLFIE